VDFFLHFLNDFGGNRRLGFLGLLLLFLAQEFLVFLVVKDEGGMRGGVISPGRTFRHR
jgi:hypothetical protein